MKAVNVVLGVMGLKSFAQVVTYAPCVWVWATVMIVNYVGIAQPCAPMKTVHFAKDVRGRFVMIVENVRFVHLIHSVMVAAFAGNVVASLFAQVVIIVVIVQSSVKIVLKFAIIALIFV